MYFKQGKPDEVRCYQNKQDVIEHSLVEMVAMPLLHEKITSTVMASA